ncbi:MAG: amino acid adenylation domain-containing protein [Gordonia sp. (in: high G+C Gram-positive bacteria)]
MTTISDHEAANNRQDRRDPDTLATTPTQRAYLTGRDAAQPLGGVDCLGYVEFAESGVTPEQLQAAVDAAVRHPSLRSAVSSTELLVDVDAPAPTVRVHDLTGEDDGGAARTAEIRERMSSSFFDLAQGDTWRVELSLLGSREDGTQRSVIHLAVALSVADLAGIVLLCVELAAHIEAQRAGRVAEPARITFADVREAQDGASVPLPSVSGEVLAGRVDELLEAPDLPAASASPGGPGTHVYRLVETVAEADWDRLGGLAEALGVTRASMILAIYAEALRRWSAEDDFLLTVPGLSTAGTQQHVLDRTRIYATRCIDDQDRSAAATFAELAAELRYRIARDVDAVVELRDAVASGSGHRGLAPYVLTYSADRPLLPERAAAVLGHPTMIRSSTPQVIIDFQTYRFTADRVHLSFDVRAGMLADGVAEQLFAVVVEAVARLADWTVDDATSRSMADLVLLPESVRREREALNSTSPMPQGRLHDDFAAAAEVAPDRVALVCTDRDTDPVAKRHAQLTYGELDDLARTLAASLMDRTEAGDLVAVDLPKGPGQIVAVLGVLYAGCAYLPIPAGLPDQRRAAIDHEACPAAVIGVDDLPERPAVPAGFVGRDVDPDATAYVIFTSGSTGTPKGVEMSHAAAANTVRDVRLRNGVGPLDALIPVASLAFDLSVFDVFGMLGAGGRLICVSELDARDPFVWLRLIGEHDVTVWNSAPMLLEMLVEAADPNATTLPLRIAMCSGDRIDRGLYRRLSTVAPDAVLVAMGGATEGGVWSNEFRIDAGTELDPEWASVPYGAPLAGQRYRVADRRGRDCGAHAVGELWIGGDSLATGYLHRPELTAERFVDLDGQRWYRTGDLGHWDARNVLVIHGRNDGQVKIRGHRIELGDVEAALRGLRGVAEAVVFPVRNKTALGAAVVLEPGAGGDGESVRDAAARVLPAYMAPSRVDVWDQLPVTGNGKVDRAAIAAHAAGEPAVRGASSSNVTASPETRLVTDVFADLLGVDVDEHTNFFASGGESLAAARLCRRLHDDGYDVGVADVLAAPTVGELAGILCARGRTDRGTPAPEVLDDAPAGDFPLTPLQRAYVLGRDGLRGQVRAGTTFALVLALGPGVEAGDVHRATQTLTDAWEALRCVRRSDTTQGTAPVEVTLERVDTPLRTCLPSYQPRHVCAVVESSCDPGEVGLVVDYLGLDARSLVTVTTALVETAGGCSGALLRVSPGIGRFAGHARQLAESAAAPREPDGERFDFELPVRRIDDRRVAFTSRRLLLSDIDGLSGAAERAGVTPSALVLHCFGSALGAALGVDRVPVTVPVSYRPDEGTAEVLGNFTRLETVVVQGAAEPRTTATQLWESVARDATRSATLDARPAGAADHRVVFTSTLGLDYSAADFDDAAPVRPVWSLTSTPGVLIDCQVMAHRDGVEIRWDHPEGVLDEHFLDHALAIFTARLEVTDVVGEIVAAGESHCGCPEADRGEYTTDGLIDAVIRHFTRTSAAAADRVLEAMTGPQRAELTSESVFRWTATDLADLVAVLDGSVPPTALLEHPSLSPEAILSGIPGFTTFVDELTADIAARARHLVRPVRVLELGTSTGIAVSPTLDAIGAAHVWRCVEPDRVLAHIAHRRGQSVSAEPLTAGPVDVVVVSASAHRDPRILRQIGRLDVAADGSVWLCEPTLDSRVILLSAAVLNPAVVEMRVNEPLWHWCTVLREAGFAPVQAVQYDGVVTVRARQSATLRAQRPCPQRELPAGRIPSKATPASGADGQGIIALVADAWQSVLGAGSAPGPDSDFFADGGDSLTGTRLIARLADAGLRDARLVDLFNNPRFGDYCAALRPEDGGPSYSSQPVTTPPPRETTATDDAAVPLTAVQRAYLAGRDPEQILGGNSAHCYFELTVDHFDFEALCGAVETVVARHPALRARVVDAWTAEVVPAHRNSQPVRCADPRTLTEAEVTDPAEPGALRVRVAEHGRGSATVGIGMENLWLDGASMFLVLGELTRAYRGQTLPPAPALGLAGYLRTHPELVNPGVAPERLNAVAAALPPAPRLWSAPLTSVARPTFERIEALVPAQIWQDVRRRAAAQRVSAPSLVLAAYVASLAEWSGDSDLSVNVTQFDRDPSTPEAALMAGDFTRLFVVGVHDAFVDFQELARTVQSAVAEGLDDAAYTTTEVARHLLARDGVPADALFPVVFTCGLGLAESGRDELFGRLDRVRSQTPQTVLDLQVTDSAEGLHLTADFVTELLPPDQVRRCVDAVVRRLWEEQVGDGPSDRLTQAWSAALGMPRVEPDTNFFQAGGDSLKATRLIQALHRDGFGELSLRTLLEHPRFGDFAARVSEAAESAPAAAFEEGIL